MRRGERWPGIVVPLVAGLAALWSVVPVGVWFAGADAHAVAEMWRAWLWGSLVAVLGTATVLLLSRGRAGVLAYAWWRRLVGRPPAALIVAVAVVLLAGFAMAMCLLAFAGNPRNVDGFAQLFQARIFLSGRLWAPPPPPAEVANFAILHVITGPLRWFSQYPPGQSLVLAAGLALGAWWLLNPLFAAVLIVATYRVARWCADETAARLAVLLLCLSPFVVAVSGSELSLLPAAALGMLAAAAATAAGAEGRRWVAAVLGSGAALGVMAAFRPLDAVAAAVAVTAILWLAAPADRRVAAVALAGLAGAVLTLPILWYNSRTTGSWHQFGYTYLWGPGHSLGFHPVPFGVPLTPLRAVGLTGNDLYQVNSYLFDAPFPVLLIVFAGLFAGRRRLAARDAVPVAGAAALSALLFFYWWRDTFYGPRFLFAAVPWLVILLARALVLLKRSGRELAPGLSRGAAAVLCYGAAMALGLATIEPSRLALYRSENRVFDLHPDRDARRDGIHRAVVVIPDGWGTRLIVRLEALGVPPPRATRLYAAIDACTLEQTLDRAALDTSGAGRARLLPVLDSLAALGRPGVRLDLSADPLLRLPPVPAAADLAPVCREELARDARGFFQFAPYLYLDRPGLHGDIVWARDLGPWNAALFARYPDRALYRYAPSGPAPGAPPVFQPLARPVESDARR